MRRAEVREIIQAAHKHAEECVAYAGYPMKGYESGIGEPKFYPKENLIICHHWMYCNTRALPHFYIYYDAFQWFMNDSGFIVNNYDLEENFNNGGEDPFYDGDLCEEDESLCYYPEDSNGYGYSFNDSQLTIYWDPSKLTIR